MTRDDIYQLERASIHAFVASHPFTGRVLDYGAGHSPYRDLVERNGAEYVAYDRANLPGSLGVAIGPDGPLATESGWDMILCTQVIQYAADARVLLQSFRDALVRGGQLVLTGPGCWHEEEAPALWRFTRGGIRRLLTQAGFRVERLEDRATVDVGGFPFSLGFGAVARA